MISGIIRNFVLLLADAVCIGGCWLVSVFGYRVCGGVYKPSFYLHMWPVVPLWLAVNILFRLYHGRLFYPAVPFSPVEEMRRLVGSAVLVHLGIIAVLALVRQTTEGYSRLVIVLSGLLTAGFAQLMRDAVRALLKRLDIGQIPTVLVGTSTGLSRLATVLRTNAYLGFAPKGYFSERTEEDVSVPRLGRVNDVTAVSRRLGIKVLFACEDVRFLMERQHELLQTFTQIEYLPRQMTFPVAGTRIVTLDGIGAIEMVNQDRMSVLRLEKWVIDKALAMVAFLLLSPALLILALLVKLSSPGPVFFRHTRLGIHGKSINIWKFRTMYVDAEKRLHKILSEDPVAAAEWKANFKLRNDARVTSLGRFLRKTSLDELPQIFNVLGGSMALVGPRPIVKDEVSYYGKSYEIFSSVKPGITGLWQISGRSDCDYDKRVALDVHYILNWSPWMDLWIVYRTIAAVLKMKGSY